MTFALTEKGFKRPVYAEILEKKIKRAKELFGDDISTDEKTALGKFIRLDVKDLNDIYEDMERIYYARFVNTAEGISLDRLCPFAGISRNPATRAVHKIKIYGEPETLIETGFLVGTKNDINFYLLGNTVIDVGGSAEANAECTVAGTKGNVDIGSITEIVNPAAGVMVIEHLSIVNIAVNRETDVALRLRFEKTITGAASGTIDSIYGALMRVSGVIGCMIAENAGDDYDAFGRPPGSFECYVLGGQDFDIAQAIFDKAPAGIKTIGDIGVDITDLGGGAHTVRFSRTIIKDVYMRLKIKVNGHFEDVGLEEIKNNIIYHIADLKNGGDVIYSSIFSDVHSVTGVIETSELLLSEDKINYKPQNIRCAHNEVARISAEDIDIEVEYYDDTM